MSPLTLHLIYIGAVLVLTYIAQYVVGKLLDIFYYSVAKKTKTKFDDEFIPLLRRLLVLGLWAFGLCKIALYFGVDIKGLLGTLGVVSIATAMVVKDSVTNIIAGVTIMFDKPFRVGDTVKIPSGEIGKILKIGIRRTHMLIGGDGKGQAGHLIIPNADLSKAKIVNFTYAKETK